jgi:UDP-N-acetylglucosamine--N-acetylmuramyl-(pentapeptide) pyrophosphoryl-undecaprenol N-acetylglucosamine transferase
LEFPTISTSDIPAHIAAPRLLFYAVNGLGLGHVTRMLAIAREVRRQRPLAQILFLTTSEADHVIFAEGFASIKLPSRSAITKTGIWPRTFLKLTHSVVMNAVASFNPAILVVDTFPAGASGELLSTLSWEMCRAFVFRAQQPERAAEAAFQTALSAYNLCIIPHQVGSEELLIPECVAQDWTGEIFIRSRDEGLSRRDARRTLGVPSDAKVLYVSFGGGGDDEIAHALTVTLAAAAGSGWTIALADAPLQTGGQVVSLPDGVIRVRHYPMAECFPAFDGAISAGGYNTVAELVHFGIPSIIIPFPRGLDDQYARVNCLATIGAILSGRLDVEQLRLQLTKLSDPVVAEKLSAKAKAQIPTNGAKQAAERILSLL